MHPSLDTEYYVIDKDTADFIFHQIRNSSVSIRSLISRIISLLKGNDPSNITSILIDIATQIGRIESTVTEFEHHLKSLKE